MMAPSARESFASSPQSVAGQTVVYLGIDGGQTGSRAVAVDATGSIRAFVEAHGLIHPLSRGGARRLRSVFEEIRLALPAALQIRAAYLALTGVEGPDSPSHGVASRIATEVWPGVDITVDNDGMAAWAGGTGCKAGVAAMAGTGSVVIAVNEQGERVRTGGWGAMLGDAGGGWRIAVAALQQMLRRWDMGSATTDLDRTLLETLGVTSPAGVAIGVSSGRIPRMRIVNLAMIIAAVAPADPAARAVLQEAAADFAVDVAAALSRLRWRGVPVPVVPIGNIFRAGAVYLEPFEQALASRSTVAFQIRAPVLSSVGGAALLSLREGGLFSDELIARLADSAVCY